MFYIGYEGNESIDHILKKMKRVAESPEGGTVSREDVNELFNETLHIPGDSLKLYSHNNQNQ